jgi:SnoaL-like domain
LAISAIQAMPVAWSARPAEMLKTSETSVNSALQRARSALEPALPPASRDRAALPRSEQEREVVTRFAEAFANDDVEGVVALLTEQAKVTMPPEPLEYEGPAAIREFHLDRIPRRRPPGTVRLVPTRANGQPAFGYYLKDPQCGIARCNGLLVLTIEGDRIAGLARFGDTGILPHFGLPGRCADLALIWAARAIGRGRRTIPARRRSRCNSA